MGPVSLPWERISSFVKFGHGFGTEYELGGTEGQTLTFAPAVFPGCQQLVRRIWMSLEHRHLQPATVATPSTLQNLHRLLLPACLLILVFGNRVHF
jgi:hypothetical protein